MKNKNSVKKGASVTRLEAKYAAYQWAWSWVSEAAETRYNSDFYQWLGVSQMLDYEKLPKDEKGEWLFYEPTDNDIVIIKSEMLKLENKLRIEIFKIKRKFQKEQTKQTCDATDARTEMK